MRRISLSEFGRMCQQYGEDEYIYCSKNQDYDETKLGLVSFSLVFKSVVVVFQPNRICFLGDSGNLCVNQVSSVVMDNKNEGVVKFIISCNDALNKEKIKKITITKTI